VNSKKPTGPGTRLIHVLPQDLADRIAAGEVVQRPASAVKELMENSVDAGAKSVTVTLKDAGRTLVQVNDDGSGMGWDDALAAFSRHATSKISSPADLDHISTLGFRGEALAAISAVASVELKTKTAAEETGTRVLVEGGALKSHEKTGCPTGTGIAVRNLFFNTPGRRKFLKSDRTEFRHILDAVQRAALSRPDIGFTLVSDGETILKSAAGDPASRIRDIFGKKQASTLIEFSDETGPVAVSGFLGRPHFARKGRADQYLFLNGRPIVSRNIGHAVYRAYEHLLEKSSFPFFVLFLVCDAGTIDVNVHPSKLEVKFEDESLVYRLVHAAAKRALGSVDLRTEMASAPQGSGDGFSLSQVIREPSARPSDPWRPLPADTVPLTDLFRSEPGAGGATGGPGGPQPESRQVWQVHDKYIISPTPEGVLIVDQHAAHERIIYEKTMVRFGAMGGESQELLFPQTIELSPTDAALVGELQPLLEKLGFVLKMFGPRTVILEGIPTDIRPGKESTILGEVLNLYREDEQRLKLDPREQLAKSYSCRAAVKAGDRLKEPEMTSLIEQLFRAEVPYVCPHGRPVMFKLSLSELDRRFGRTS
jgi:DNA mismatch repair protein MutL